MFKKIIFIPVMGLIVLLVGFMFLLKGCLTVYNTYGVVGSPAMTADGSKVVILVAECEATSHQENGGFRKTTYNTSYWLKCYDTQSGKLLEKKKILKSAEKQNITPECYGSFGNTVWLNTDGLRAYDINTLNEVVNEKMIIEKNKFDPSIFPYEDRFINEAISKGFIYFTATTAEKYRLNIQTLEIVSLENLPEDAKAEADEDLKYVFRHEPAIGQRCDIVNGKSYILSTDISSAESVNPNNNDGGTHYKRLFLFSADCTIGRLGNHDTYIYKNLKKISDSAFISGVFLKDSKTDLLAKPIDSNSYVILQHASISADTRTILSAVNQDAKIHWRTVTELSTKIEHCTVTNNVLALTGNRRELSGPYIGLDLLAIVSLKDGQAVYPKLND